jgi:FKBP-type peptidyl-prolyl cis-trans isomerase FklB
VRACFLAVRHVCLRGTSGVDLHGIRWTRLGVCRAGVITLPSGLQYRVLRSGSGEFHPTADSACDCHYAGTLIDGTEFDSSYKRGEPTSFAPNQVIKGWTEAMQLMVEGDKWEMYIPSDLGYGDRGSPPKIGGGDALIFQMEIIKIKGNKVPALNCNPATQAGCNDQEKEFITKVQPWTADKVTSELSRLNKMKSGSMKPELASWLNRRFVWVVWFPSSFSRILRFPLIFCACVSMCVSFLVSRHFDLFLWLICFVLCFLCHSVCMCVCCPTLCND